MEISPIEARILGSLMEKAKTTPDAYPLTLNALLNACNQKTSRDPVCDYDEDEVLKATEGLREKHLVIRVDMAGSRTAKFRENISQHWELGRGEYALLAVLLLRGAQTPGQLRQRSERLHPFASLDQVSSCLDAMQHREEEPVCLVRSLGRMAGAKEMRYAHTLFPPGETVHPGEADPPREGTPQAVSADPEPGRLDVLETSLQELQDRVARLEQTLDELTS